jgi:hypothetical protein
MGRRKALLVKYFHRRSQCKVFLCFTFSQLSGGVSRLTRIIHSMQHSESGSLSWTGGVHSAEEGDHNTDMKTVVFDRAPLHHRMP